MVHHLSLLHPLLWEPQMRFQEVWPFQLLDQIRLYVYSGPLGLLFLLGFSFQDLVV